LSSSEAEYPAISEVAAELKPVKNVLDFLEIEPGGLITVLVGNIGEIHLASNASSGSLLGICQSAFMQRGITIT
jgi:hypothetical protein